MKQKLRRPAAWLPISLCWLAYTAAYLGRYSYAANIAPIMDTFGLTHTEAGLVTTCFFFAYGIGQVAHGILCRRYSRRWMVPFALLVSAALNLCVYAGAPFPWLKYFWLLNGAVQSVLWPTLILILSESLDARDLAKSVVAMGSTTAAGTFGVYGLSAAFVRLGRYAHTFLWCAAIMAAAALAWVLLFPRAFSGAESKENESRPLRPDASLAGMLLMLGFFAVVCNLVRDGLNTWVPVILKERYALPDSLSILLTLVLPVLGIFGAAANTRLARKIPSFITLSGLWYLAIAGLIAVVIALENTGLWFIVLGAFGLVSLMTHGINSLITGMAPLYLRENIHSGTLAGLLNGCCYIGSTISAYGLGSIADRSGWNGVFWLLLAACALCALLAVGYRGKPASK